MKTTKQLGCQIGILDGSDKLTIKKPIRLIELFAGIGAQAKALENRGVDFDHYRICEFDKYAVKSYNAVHGTNFETSDITKITADDLNIVDTDKYTYIMTYSFPCTDLSKAGKQKGMSKGSGTRSGLLWEVERLLREISDSGRELPQILLMENVPDVVSEKNKDDFFDWCAFLERIGYTNKYDILNAKDFGVPQNRERCFMVSWLGEGMYYDFPTPKPLTKRLKDVLEKEVDEKYYLSDNMIKYFINHSKEQKDKGNGFRFSPTDGNCIGKSVTTKAGSRIVDNFIEIKCEHIAQIDGKFEMANRVYSKDGLCPTIRAMQGGGLEPKILEEPLCLNSKDENGNQPSLGNRVYDSNAISTVVTTSFMPSYMVYDGYNHKLHKDSSTIGTLTTNCGGNGNGSGFAIFIPEATKKGYAEANDGDSINIAYPDPTTRRGRVGKQIAQTITAQNQEQCVVPKYRVRKLTSKECWRLMGFDDDSFKRAEKEVSNSQLYKQAGNSIVVDVLMEIFKNMM